MNESGENYLETILILQQRQKTVRAIDIAAELGYSKPSVSRAMGILRMRGLIDDSGGAIVLTDRGNELARSIYERHNTIALFLSSVLGVSNKTAETDACRVEHIISEETFQKIKQMLNDSSNCKDS